MAGLLVTGDKINEFEVYIIYLQLFANKQGY